MRWKNVERLSPIQLFLLSKLSKEPVTVTYLLNAMEEHFKEYPWRPHRGVIYPALNKLKRKGLIEETEIDGKKAYYLSSETLKKLDFIFEEFLMHLRLVAAFFYHSVEALMKVDSQLSKKFLQKRKAMLLEELKRIDIISNEEPTDEDKWFSLKLE